MSSSAGGRVEAVGVIRAVVCLGILVKHFSTADGFSQHWPWLAGVGVRWVSGTECFLVVSGYFLSHMFRPGRDQFLSLRAFARRRVYRLLVPYWVALGLAYTGLAVWRLVVPAPTPEGMFSPLAVLANVLCVPDLFAAPTPMMFFWTVATLLQVYALWSAAFWCVRQVYLLRGLADYHHRTEGVMIALTGAVLVAGGWLTWSGVVPPGGWQLPLWITYVAGGMFAHWTTRGRVSGLVFPLLLACFGAGAAATDSPRPLFAGLTGLLLVAAGRGLLTPTGLVSRGLAAAGEWSYSVYLMHGLVGVRVWSLMALVGVTPDTPLTAALLLLAAVATSVLAGWVLYVLVERPMTRRAAGVSYRR